MAVFLALFFYKGVYRPLKLRLHFQKYPNVYTTSQYKPVIGDAEMLIKATKEEHRSSTYYFLQALSKQPGYDIVFANLALIPFIALTSIKSVEEFKRLLPSHIDRDDYVRYAVG